MNKIEELVYDWNNLLYEKYKIEDSGFEYISSGFSSAVTFGGFYFWESENDRPQEGETEEETIKRKFKEFQTMIQKIEL